MNAQAFSEAGERTYLLFLAHGDREFRKGTGHTPIPRVPQRQIRSACTAPLHGRMSNFGVTVDSQIFVVLVIRVIGREANVGDELLCHRQSEPIEIWREEGGEVGR